jgi:hypothetical protein
MKTKSCDFILSELKKEFILETIFINTDIGNPYENLEYLKNQYFDILICWQIIPDISSIKRIITFDKGVVFPMYDAVPSRRKIEKWWHIRDFQIICFSRKLHIEFKRLGLSSNYIQYFPKPAIKLSYGNPNSAFFWYRHRSITGKDAELICSKLKLNHIHIHNANDPGHEDTINKDSKNLNITTSSWFESREELYNTMLKSAYFIAPRNKEGIGMAFLEAMAQGKCVIAKDSSTMNEYIKHNENGILYKKNISNLEFNLKKIQRNAFASIACGYKKWEVDKGTIINYIKEDPKNNIIRLYFMVFIGILTNPMKVLRVIFKNCI